MATRNIHAPLEDFERTYLGSSNAVQKLLCLIAKEREANTETKSVYNSKDSDNHKVREEIPE